MKVKLTCIVLSFILIISSSTLFVSGESTDNKEVASNKISIELQNTIEQLDENDKIDIAVWLDDYDESVYDDAFTVSLKESINKNVITTDIDTARELFYSNTLINKKHYL